MVVVLWTNMTVAVRWELETGKCWLRSPSQHKREKILESSLLWCSEEVNAENMEEEEDFAWEKDLPVLLVQLDAIKDLPNFILVVCDVEVDMRTSLSSHI